jgi:uncharacterized protein (TIGR03435 family)
MHASSHSRSKAFLPAVGILAMAMAISLRIAGAAQNSAQSAAGAPLSFDAASIKERNGSLPPGIVGIQTLPGRLIGHCVTLRSLLFFAYHLTLSSPVTGLPDWASTPCSDTSTVNTYEFQATMPTDSTDDQTRQMMQTFLADRFKLVVHWEKKDRPVYALVIGPEGFKLKPSDPKNDPPRAPGSLGCPAEDRACHIMATGSVPVSQFAAALGGIVGRPVIDKTGLTGTYYLDLKWAGDTSADSPLPSLPAALKETFGLELKSQTAPVDTLVIDHVEKPTPN